MHSNPFEFFNNADPAQLASSFQNENPQLIALILAYLRPEISAKVLNSLPSVTYEFYLNHIKPKTLLNDENKVGYVCKICGYFYEGKTIPQDFICPLCKHGASDFEFIG